MRIPFRRRRPEGPADDVTIDEEPTLPFGIPHPVTQTAAVTSILDCERPRHAAAGIPQPGDPQLPMIVELQMQQHHDEDQRALGLWFCQIGILQPALINEAAERKATLAQQAAQHQGRRQGLNQERDELEQQFSEQDRRFGGRLGPWGMTFVIVVVLGLAGLETSALQPILGQVLRQSDAKAWSLALFVVTIVTALCDITGGAFHRWVTYEGPRRIRLAHAVVALLGAGLAIAALIAVVVIRLAGAKNGTPAWASLLYISAQGGVEIGAFVVGWWHANPRVRQLRGLNEAIEEITEHIDEIGAEVLQVSGWEEQLREFSPEAFLAERRPQLSAEYAAIALRNRDLLRLELLEQGHRDSADTLLLLPSPTFLPPAPPDDDDEWLNGGFMIHV